MSKPVSSGYECKTCSKRFDSFQALGGHQGIHKKVDDDDINNDDEETLLTLNIVADPKKSLGMHRCKTCMKEFETGPALGGHMTRHRLQKEPERVQEDVMIMKDEKAGQNQDLKLAAKEWQLWI
ncbi:hypothetical protein L1987_72554 [Smallanthus sonchifolius]|uniref:Uncharacterized protein n=1 Tax=Smallanthus sonchifolius TaxID=185202 RepID=A0ACB9AZX8_9ASTR|nr:hypothetical protein L1987_72554 [Smallanthus sonchifolius]